MKKFVFIFFATWFFTQTIFACTDAKRIIVLAPDLTEILFSIGAGNQIVGVMQGSDYPASAKTLPIVASFNHLDREKILTLHPDLIVTWQDVSFLSELKKLSIPLYINHPKKLLDIPHTMRDLGCLTGNKKTAEQAAILFTQHYTTLKTRYAKQKKLTVFYQVWPRPLMTVSKNSWINEMIELCGGENIFASLKNAAPLISQESVVAKNPDVIVGNGVENWRAFTKMTAVANHHVFTVNPDLIERAGPRILLGADALCSQFEKARHANSTR